MNCRLAKTGCSFAYFLVFFLLTTALADHTWPEHWKIVHECTLKSCQYKDSKCLRTVRFLKNFNGFKKKYSKPFFYLSFRRFFSVLTKCSEVGWWRDLVWPRTSMHLCQMRFAHDSILFYCLAYSITFKDWSHAELGAT